MKHSAGKLALASAVSDALNVHSELAIQRDDPLCAATPIPAPSDDPLITAKTACALAGDISRMTLWRWGEAGIIPRPLTIRGRNYYRRSAFLEALAAAAQGTRDTAEA
jgi:hypothetical protein